MNEEQRRHDQAQHTGIHRLDALIEDIMTAESLWGPRLTRWSLGLPESVKSQASRDIEYAAICGILAGLKYGCAFARYANCLEPMIKATLYRTSREIAYLEDEGEPAEPGRQEWEEILANVDRFVKRFCA